jgi:hypothetical protein
MRRSSRGRRNGGFVILIAAVGLSGCGVIGAPVAPEDVGVAPIIERQKRREADAEGRALQKSTGPPVDYPGLTASEGDASQLTDDLPVPPLQSVGTKP